MDDPSILIIGAGFAGLSTGIYAQMNGYRTQIFEMHNLPGGLCTAWKRQGYTIVEVLDQRLPGISGQVEMVDVATPLTFERYTGNWKGSFEGWLITPQNSSTLISPMRQTLPGLQNFYMCGQWVQPGGGLPTGVMTGRKLVQALCKEDGKKFEATAA